MADDKDPKDTKKVTDGIKNKANVAIIATMASQIAAGLAGTDFFHQGRNVNEDMLADVSVSIAKKILAKAAE